MDKYLAAAERLNIRGMHMISPAFRIGTWSQIQKDRSRGFVMGYHYQATVKGYKPVPKWEELSK